MDGRSVTAAEISSFQREGFVRIAGLLPRDEVKRFGAAASKKEAATNNPSGNA